MAQQVRLDATEARALTDRLAVLADCLRLVKANAGSTHELGSDDLEQASVTVALAIRRVREALVEELEDLHGAGAAIVEAIKETDAELAGACDP
ncbi:MAG TPA: hypothetical protein VK507_07835 [Iamia sp.]|nr:hypothetical protein [Iamia sp.]